MSSLAATQADGYYYPPNVDPQKHSRNKHGSNQWEKRGVIRFELPHRGHCESCDAVIDQGTRFNAKKLLAGTYLSSKIWAFEMQCPACKAPFRIVTDPAKSGYTYESGIRRSLLSFSAEEEEQEEAANAQKATRGNDSALQRLEREALDKARAEKHAAELQSLSSASESRSKHDYAANRALRARHRARRKRDAELAREGKNAGLPYALLPASAADVRRAQRGMAHASSQRVHQASHRNRLAILAQPILPSSSASAPAASSSSKILQLDAKRRKLGLDPTKFRMLKD